MNLAVLLAAFGATGMELAEAALVVSVVVSRGRRRPALLGAAAAAVVVILLAVLLGPSVIGLVPLDRLRQILGGGVLVLGCFWLAQSVLRPGAAGRELAGEAAAADRWARRGRLAAGLVSAKAVAVEGAEAAVLVVAVGEPHHAVGSAVAGAAVALAVVVALAVRVAPALAELATHSLNRVGGTALAAIGCYWLLEAGHLSAPVACAVAAGPAVLVTAAWLRWWREPPQRVASRLPAGLRAGAEEPVTRPG